MKKGFAEVFAILLVFLVVMWFIVLLFFNPRYSTTRGGTHTGYITAVQQEGFFFHPYTVYFKTDNSSSQEDVYCIREANVELAEKAKSAQRLGTKVTIDYDGERGLGWHLCSQDRIDNIELK